jgi:outer membrane protein OmpA-like peptidoglycan-associated protein
MGNPMAVDVPGAQRAADTGTPFQSALHREYANLASIEWTEADWGNSKFFADRARASAAGQSMGPTPIESRKIRADRMDEVQSMHTRVANALTNDVTTRLPQQAAHVQAMYDCWVEEVEERNQPKDEADCLTELNNSLAQLTPAAAPAPAPQPAAQAPARPLLVFFDWDKSDISQSARPTVDAIANTIKNTKPRHVLIAGHADRSGPDDYNMKLSKRRADTVAGDLARQGADRSTFQVEAYGETRPLVQTPDGVREPQNRRVEVTIEQPTVNRPGS